MNETKLDKLLKDISKVYYDYDQYAGCNQVIDYDLKEVHGEVMKVLWLAGAKRPRLILNEITRTCEDGYFKNYWNNGVYDFYKPLITFLKETILCFSFDEFDEKVE